MSVNDIFENKHDTEVFMKGFVLGGNNSKNTIISKGEDAIKFIVENGTILCTNDIGNSMKLMIVAYYQDTFAPIDVGEIDIIIGLRSGVDYASNYEYVESNGHYFLPYSQINPQFSMLCPNYTKNIHFFTVIMGSDKYMFAFSNKQGYCTVPGKHYQSDSDNILIQERIVGEYCPPITTLISEGRNISIECAISQLTRNNISFKTTNLYSLLTDGSSQYKTVQYIDSTNISGVSVTIKFDEINYKPQYKYTNIYIDDKYVDTEKRLVGFTKSTSQISRSLTLAFDQYASGASGHISLLPYPGCTSFYVNSTLHDYKKFYMWINDYWTTLNHYFGCTDIVSPERIIFDPETMLIE